MSEISNTNGNNNSSAPFNIDRVQAESMHLPAHVDTLFQHLAAQDVEQFYKSYHLWSLQRRIETLYTEFGAIEQAITDNGTLMQQVQPSAIALASLAQLQASGVNSLDLLDKMLERGETWLDHTMQLLEQCEKLDVIRGDYTQWCEHALEGAYTWIASMEATNTIDSPESIEELPPTSDTSSTMQQTELQTATEEQLLQKLMSDEETTEKTPALSLLSGTEQENEISLPSRKITQPLEQVLPSRKITQPLEQLMPEDAATIATGSPIETPWPQELVESEPFTGNSVQESAQIEEEDARNIDSTNPVVEYKAGTETLEHPSEQIDKVKDITEEEEKREISVPEVDDITHKIEAASKHAYVSAIKAQSEERVLNKEIPDQTSTGSVTPPENQRKRGSQGIFWRFLRRLFAIFYRRR